MLLHSDSRPSAAAHSMIRQLLIICLMVLTLFGVQLAKDSPLHGHEQHSLDCELCHLQSCDDVLIQLCLALVFGAKRSSRKFVYSRFYSSTRHSPYYSRAPPSSSVQSESCPLHLFLHDFQNLHAGTKAGPFHRMIRGNKICIQLMSQLPVPLRSHLM
jgi:hypothetical protein